MNVTESTIIYNDELRRTGGKA
jgi:hypothetical protein